ncbi:MAG TPA: hypothetical protein PKA38_00160 [Candidatus Levybacteria bacterium]|nr:hypothetical protein [Candidatus Levybacteria bacterium]
MTATGHALVATILIAKFNNPYIGLPLAFASHFVCDIIPHWDAGTHHAEKTKKRLFYEASLDVIISVIVSILVYTYVFGQTNYLYLFTAIFLSQLPDWLTAPYFILNIKDPLVGWSKYVYKLQHAMNVRLDKPWGILTQVGAIILLYLLLFRIF